MSNKKLILLAATAGILLSAILAVLLLKTTAPTTSAQEGTTAADARGGRVLSPEARTVNKPLPEARLTDLEGREVSAEELRRGRYLLVFFTTGCSPCVDEADNISRLLRDGDSKTRVYGVGVEASSRVAEFVKARDFKFPVLLDKDSGLRESLGVKIFPSKFLVEDGVVKTAWLGKAPDEAMLRSQLALAEVR